VSICIIEDGHIFILEMIGERVCTRIYEAIASRFRPFSFLFIALGNQLIPAELSVNLDIDFFYS
jgi:hypothetical protein